MCHTIKAMPCTTVITIVRCKSERKAIILEVRIDFDQKPMIFILFQLVTLETTLRMYWRDPRLQVDHLIGNSSSDYILLHPETSKFIWFPDIYIGKKASKKGRREWKFLTARLKVFLLIFKGSSRFFCLSFLVVARSLTAIICKACMRNFFAKLSKILLMRLL